MGRNQKDNQTVG